MTFDFDSLVAAMDQTLTEQLGTLVVFEFETGHQAIKILIEQNAEEYGNSRQRHFYQSEYTAEVPAVYFNQIAKQTKLQYQGRVFEVIEKKPVVNNQFIIVFTLPADSVSQSENSSRHRWQK
jgi:hypothetical protein